MLRNELDDVRFEHIRGVVERLRRRRGCVRSTRDGTFGKVCITEFKLHLLDRQSEYVLELVGPATDGPAPEKARAMFTSGRKPSADLAEALAKFGLTAEFARAADV